MAAGVGEAVDADAPTTMINDENDDDNGVIEPAGSMPGVTQESTEAAKTTPTTPKSKLNILEVTMELAKTIQSRDPKKKDAAVPAAVAKAKGGKKPKRKTKGKGALKTKTSNARHHKPSICVERSRAHVLARTASPSYKDTAN